MTRSGSFIPSQSTDNQCVKVGNEQYDYTLKLVFSTNQILDNDDFIIRHEEIDEQIQRTILNGSCEFMHRQLFSSLKAFFNSKDIIVIGYKATILPYGVPEKQLIASLNYIWTTCDGMTFSKDYVLQLLH